MLADDDMWERYKDIKEGIDPTEKSLKRIEEEARAKAEGALPKTPTTAMGAYLKQKPDATPDEIAVFAQKLKGKGIRATLPDGTIIEIGGGLSDITPTMKTKVQEKLLNTNENLARLKRIKGKIIDPATDDLTSTARKIFTYKGGIEALVTEIKGKAGVKLSKEDLSFANKFWKLKRSGIEEINLYIKEITGAQMSEREANRLRLARPDPGEHWWSGDAPDEYVAKLKDSIEMMENAQLRYTYMLSNGVLKAQFDMMRKNDALPDAEKTKDMIRQEAFEIRDVLIEHGMDEATAQTQATATIKKKYGY